MGVLHHCIFITLNLLQEETQGGEHWCDAELAREGVVEQSPIRKCHWRKINTHTKSVSLAESLIWEGKPRS